MSKITAGQHVYGNVEVEESPSGTRGFQTLYYTKNLLTGRESDEIENRLRYILSDQNPQKLVFFRLGERFVTSRIIPLEKTDKFGRKGLYFAHSFIFSKEDFGRLRFNPFQIFLRFSEKFSATLEAALALGKKGDMDIPPAEFSFDDGDIQSVETGMVSFAKQWPAVNLQKIILCTSGEPDAESVPVILTGPQDAIRETLQAVFALLPDNLRSSCAFDTHFTGFNPAAIKYTVYGYPDNCSASNNGICVNAGTKAVPDVKTDFSTPYRQWILRDATGEYTGETATYRNAVFELDHYLTNKNYDKELVLESLTAPGVERILEANETLLRAKMDEYLKGQLSETLLPFTTSLGGKVFQVRPRTAALKTILVGFSDDEIARTLFEEMKDLSPSRAQVNALDSYLSRHKDRLLHILYLKWRGESDEISRLLLGLSDEDYTMVLPVLIGFMDLKSLVTEKRIAIFSDLFLREAEKSKELRDAIPELAELFFDSDQMTLCASLNPLLPSLTRKQIGGIQEVIEHQSEKNRAKVPDEFNKALADAIEKSKNRDDMLGLDNLIGKISFFKRK